MAIVEVRAILKDRETWVIATLKRQTCGRLKVYRGRKDSALALYYLWRIGDVMTHHRERFERVYALTENVARRNWIYEKTRDEADRFSLERNQFWRYHAHSTYR